jgi:hypothetical protein
MNAMLAARALRPSSWWFGSEIMDNVMQLRRLPILISCSEEARDDTNKTRQVGRSLILRTGVKEIEGETAGR